MGYAAIYPTGAIEAHRAFIARRRALRPVEEYRTVTPEEWDEFLGHFERRKLALGDCGRAYGPDCAHEHACVRCPVLIVHASERPRLVEIRDKKTAEQPDPRRGEDCPTRRADRPEAGGCRPGNSRLPGDRCSHYCGRRTAGAFVTWTVVASGDGQGSRRRGGHAAVGVMIPYGRCAAALCTHRARRGHRARRRIRANGSSGTWREGWGHGGRRPAASSEHARPVGRIR